MVLPGERRWLSFEIIASDTGAGRIMDHRSDFGSRSDVLDFLRNMTHKPGVYQMLGADREVLYIGKAKNLKKRVASYFQKRGLGTKTQLMIQQMRQVEVTVTSTEAEALLLENNLIKHHHPRYNVLLKDDKSYPYIHVSDEVFPKLSFYRGGRKQAGQYYGPYSSVVAVRETLNLIFKLFRLRQCDTSVFKNRTRPCLQHQIKRCSAPCVGLIGKADYNEDLTLATDVLSGHTQKVITTLVERMNAASEHQEYELAARCRDRIQALRQVSERQCVSFDKGDVDVIACAIKAGSACVQVLSVRGGLNVGTRAYYPRLPYGDVSAQVLLNKFIGQYYLSRQIPQELVVSHVPDDAQVLQQMLESQAKRKVLLTTVKRGKKYRWVKFALENAALSLDSRLSSRAGMQKRLTALRKMLGLQEIPTRMECFDVSHTQGESAVASCVVFDASGPLKSEYRRFNIKDITAGDDYAAIHQAIARRYRRLVAGEGKLPDVLFVDGGKGQVAQAKKALRELCVDGVMVVGVAKGAERKPGAETLLLADGNQFIELDTDSTALYLVQQIRDEAHAFAITGHRRRRLKRRNRSLLEDIAGIGIKRRQRLMSYFGGLQGISAASAGEISKVPGISRCLAESIHAALRAEAGGG